MNEFQRLQELDILLQFLRRSGIYRRAKNELNDASIMVLFHISFRSQYQHIRATDVAKALGVTLPAITHKVNDLIKQGYITKTVLKEDRRVSHLLLTQKGIAYVDAIRDKYYASLKNVVAGLGERDTVTFIRLLEKINRRGKKT